MAVIRNAPSKNPSTVFYFNDWDNDPELKTCSLAAQGLWMRLLCIAARSPEPGIVQIGSHDMSPPHGLTLVASAVGKPLDEVSPLIDELLTSGAASRDRKGRIYCRRMVRKGKVSLARSEAGKLGHAASTGRERENGPEPGKPPGKPPPPSGLQTPELLPHGENRSVAPRASAPDGTRAGAAIPILILSGAMSLWKIRLQAHRPGAAWQAGWGPAPESEEDNPRLDAGQRREWRRHFGLEPQWRAAAQQRGTGEVPAWAARRAR
jgi:hypothetical protein